MKKQPIYLAITLACVITCTMALAQSKNLRNLAQTSQTSQAMLKPHKFRKDSLEQRMKHKMTINSHRVRLMISQRGYPASIAFEARKYQYKFELSSNDVLRLTGDNKQLLVASGAEFDTTNLIYSVRDPVIRYYYENHGQRTWKLLKVNFFESYPTKLISRCQGQIIVGGPCKTSDVSTTSPNILYQLRCTI